jgi:hypothetical protein
MILLLVLPWYEPGIPLIIYLGVKIDQILLWVNGFIARKRSGANFLSSLTSKRRKTPVHGKTAFKPHFIK